MLRLNLNLFKVKSLVDSFYSSKSNLSPILTISRLFHGSDGLLVPGGNEKVWIGPPDLFHRVGLGSEWGSGGIQQVRQYHVNNLSVLWYRRRRKAMEQRLRVLNPSSPVIEQMTPLPPTNEGRYPPTLFQVPEIKDFVQEEEEKKGVVAQINRQVEDKGTGRLFAVINVKGKQFKVTAEDIIIIQGYWAPNIGDRLRLHKIMLLGGSDFTLLGRPLLDNNLVRVEGTIIEKTMSYTKLHFRLKKRKNFRRLKFFKDPYTMLRINMIELLEQISVPHYY